MDTGSVIDYIWLGRCPYPATLDLQRQLQKNRIAGIGRDCLLACEHSPGVITAGKRTKPESLLLSPAELSARSIVVHQVERGGDATYHGPGQLVLYPILDLRKKRQDVDWYMRSLELVLQHYALSWGIEAVQIPKNTGLWVQTRTPDTVPDKESAGTPPPEVKNFSKIASIGVRISRWCTLHGCSLNVWDCSEGFSVIQPCGYAGTDVTSIEEELRDKQTSKASGSREGGAFSDLSMQQAAEDVSEIFARQFEYQRSDEHDANTAVFLKNFKEEVEQKNSS